MRQPADKVARASRWVFKLAGVYGLAVLLPTYFMVDEIGRRSETMTHLEYFYGFTGAGVAWQLAFLVIASDVLRYRPLMIAAIAEKLAFAIPAIWIASVGRLPAMTLPFAVIDCCLAALFTACYVGTMSRAGDTGSHDDH